MSTSTIAPTVTESVLQRVRDLGPSLRERALDAERNGRLSTDMVADLDAAGVFNIASPAEHGGFELSVAEQLQVVAEVSKWDGSCGWIVWAAASTNWIPARMGARVIEEVYGPDWVGPRVAGSSHFPASRGRVKRVAGGWLVSGGPWTFASGSLWSPFTNLGCIADDGEGPYLVGVQMPADQLAFLDDWNVAGMKGTGSVSVTLLEDEVLVPEHRAVVFSEIMAGSIESGLAGSLWNVPTLGWAFSTMAGMSIGIAKGAVDRFLERAAGRPIRGTTYTNQIEAPLTHLMLSEVHSKIRSAELMSIANAEESDRIGAALAAGDEIDGGYLQRFSARVLVETAYAAKWCAEAVELVQRNSGSTAIMDFDPIQRSWRDARVVTLHGALNLEALAENHGRLMAGLQPLQFEGITTLDRFATNQNNRKGA